MSAAISPHMSRNTTVPFFTIFTLSLVLFAGCDDDEVTIVPKSTAKDTEELVQTYWRSWQNKDWEGMRKTLAPDFQAGALKGPDALVEISKKGNPWRDVTMLDAVYGEEHATIVYRAVDTVTLANVQVAELLRIENGKIRTATGTFSSTPPATPSVNRPPATHAFSPVFPDQPDGAAWSFMFGSEKTPSAFFIRVPPGFTSPKHRHTSAYFGVVLEGLVKNGPDVELAPELPAGSYWSQKAGEEHVTACLAKTPCLSFIVYEGPFDLSH